MYQLLSFQVLHQQTLMVTPYGRMPFPNAKETRTRREAGPQTGQGKAAEVQRSLRSCPSPFLSPAQGSTELSSELLMASGRALT